MEKQKAKKVFIEYERCDHCPHRYPINYLKPFASGLIKHEKVCGICALDLLNQSKGLHAGNSPKHFPPGTTAEKLRQLAIKRRLRGQKTISRLGEKKK